MLKEQKKLPSSSEKHDIEVSKQKYDSKAHRAKEFSKNIPKPVVVAAAAPQKNDSAVTKQQNRNNSYGDEVFSEYDGYDDNNYNTISRGAAAPSGTKYSQDDLAEMKLQQLTAKHNQSKLQVESIRKAMGRL